MGELTVHLEEFFSNGRTSQEVSQHLNYPYVGAPANPTTLLSAPMVPIEV